MRWFDLRVVIWVKLSYIRSILDYAREIGDLADYYLDSLAQDLCCQHDIVVIRPQGKEPSVKSKSKYLNTIFALKGAQPWYHNFFGRGILEMPGRVATPSF